MYPQILMATVPQKQKINVLLNQMGIKDMKEKLCLDVSNQRTTHLSELTKLEAKNVITWLIKQNPAERNKEAIIALAYKAGIIWGHSYEDKKMNMAKLDAFLLRRGAVKKRLHELQYNDIIKVHRQFEAILSSQRKTAANKDTAALFKELNILVETKKR